MSHSLQRRIAHALVWLTAYLCIALLVLPGAVPAHADASVIDLATLPAETDLAPQMYVLDANGQTPLTPADALKATGWAQGAPAQAMLKAPRELSTIWLTGTFKNTDDTPLFRWLNLSPWRLTQVDAWFMEPESQQVLSHAQTGISVPLDQRSINNSRALLPAHLAPGEKKRILIKIHSTSRPFLTIHSREPAAFTVDKAARYQSDSVLLASILTLLAVLLLQGTRRYALIGVWLLVTFIFESEKEGYISFVLFPGLAEYAGNLRFTTWLLTSALFLTTSVYLLERHQERRWRWLPAATLLCAGGFGALSFVLNPAVMRHIGSLIDLTFAGIWLLLIPGVLKQKRPWQRVILACLGLWWVAYTFILLGYVFNFYYTSAFASSKIIVEIIAILGLLLVYAQQKRAHEQYLTRQLRMQEAQQRNQLERAVTRRTQELSQAVQEASHANAAKTDFLTRITHDLRSPLTSILGYAQLLSTESGRTGDMSRTIHASASHMLDLVNRLITYARGPRDNPMHPTDIYLFSFVESIAQEAQTATQRSGNTFHLDMAADLPPIVRCDATWLRQILLNLLDNAAKHTENGAVNLIIAPDTRQDDVGIMFTVSDTGCGIPAEIQNHLWEPFYQPSGQREGLGLGLSIVQQLTCQLDGTIELTSQPGQGTRICITLPLAAGREDNASALVTHLPHHVLPTFDATGLNVLVVEDADAIREFLYTELDGLGFAPQLFASAEAFMQAIKVASAPPDLVITDHHLPGTSSDTVRNASQRLFPEVPVVRLSATQRCLQERLASEHCNSAGYAACLTKPVDLATLRRTLASLCQRELHATTTADALNAPAPHAAGVTSHQHFALSREEHNRLKQLIMLGAVTDLTEWCEALADQDPTRRELAGTLYDLASRGRFAAISEMLASIDTAKIC